MSDLTRKRGARGSEHRKSIILEGQQNEVHQRFRKKAVRRKSRKLSKAEVAQQKREGGQFLEKTGLAEAIQYCISSFYETSYHEQSLSSLNYSSAGSKSRPFLQLAAHMETFDNMVKEKKRQAIQAKAAASLELENIKARARKQARTKRNSMIHPHKKKSKGEVELTPMQKHKKEQRIQARERARPWASSDGEPAMAASTIEGKGDAPEATRDFHEEQTEGGDTQNWLVFDDADDQDDEYAYIAAHAAAGSAVGAIYDIPEVEVTDTMMNAWQSTGSTGGGRRKYQGVSAMSDTKVGDSMAVADWEAAQKPFTSLQGLSISVGMSVATELAGGHKKGGDTTCVVQAVSGSAQAPAAISGVQPGDVVKAIDGQNIVTEAGFVNMIGSHFPGETVTLDLLRNGAALKVPLLIGAQGYSIAEVMRLYSKLKRGGETGGAGRDEDPLSRSQVGRIIVSAAVNNAVESVFSNKLELAQQQTRADAARADKKRQERLQKQEQKQKHVTDKLRKDEVVVETVNFFAKLLGKKKVQSDNNVVLRAKQVQALKATEITDELAKVEAELAEKQGKAKKLSKVIGVEIVESYYPDWDRDVAMTVCVLSARNAYKAGVREEDIVLSLNGTAVDTLPEFRTQMDAVNAGDVIELEIVRNMVNYRKLTALRAKRNKGRKPVAKNKKKEKQAVMDDEKEKVFVFKIEVDPLVITPREARQLHARIDALRKERALLLGRQVFLATRKKAEVLEAKKRAARLEEENKHNNRRGRRQRNRGQSTAATPKSARRSKDPSQQRGGKGKSTTGNRTARTAKRGRTGKKQEAVAAAAAASSEQQAEQKQPTKEQIDAAWEAHHDDSRKLDYYYNTVTQESTWEVPPATWEEHFDSATKEPYYYNPLTDVTQWDSPFENLRKKRKKKGKKKSSASSRKR